MNKTQEWLEQWMNNITFISQDDLTKLVFKDILTKFQKAEVFYGPDADRKKFNITINNSDGVSQITIPLSE